MIHRATRFAWLEPNNLVVAHSSLAIDGVSLVSGNAPLKQVRANAASAVAAFEQLLTDRLRVLGPDHPHTLSSAHNLAIDLRELGEADDGPGSHDGVHT